MLCLFQLYSKVTQFVCVCVCVCVCVVGYFLCFCLLAWISHTPSLSSCVCGRDEVPIELLCILRASQVALVVKNLPAKAGDIRAVGSFLDWKIPWKRAWQPTPVFLPGESHRQRSLVGYGP